MYKYSESEVRMADEEQIAETYTKEDKSPVNIWKILLICLVSFGLIVAICLGIYNSDWFINKTLKIKKVDDAKLGRNATWSYINKYEDNVLKINLTVKNVDEKVMKIVDNYWKEDEDLMQLVFVDKDGFKLAELAIPKGNFVHITSEKGQYTAQSSLKIEKRDVRKIKDIEPKYREVLDIRYDDLIKEIDSRYRRAVGNLFGF